MPYILTGFTLGTAVAAAGLFAIVSGPPTLPAIAGQWAQSSQGKELVLVPRIKLQPNLGVGTGTSLGGTVGYGSMTRTAIVTEPVPMDVTRSMTLAITPAGRFEWTITRRHAEDGGCTRTTTQLKQGRVRVDGSQLVFAVSEGGEQWRSSCGKQGSGRIKPVSESYAVSFDGQSMQLASGPSRWTFNRR